MARQYEAVLRLALGASRLRLFGPIIGESAVLSLAGGILGAIVAYLLLQWFRTGTPVDLPRGSTVGLDWRALGFSAIVAALSALISGLIPAWRFTRPDMQRVLRAGPGTASDTTAKARSRSALVAVEVAFSTALLILGLLFAVSFVRLPQAERGFEAQSVVIQDILTASPRYTPDVRVQFIADALRGFQEIPGVVAAAVTNQLPARGETDLDGLVDPSHETEVASAPPANVRFVSADYWRALGIAVRDGRVFAESDRNQPVVVISEQTARRMWPGDAALGR